MKFLYALRYFQVVALVPWLFIAGFVVAVGAAAVRLTTDPASATEALTPVLLLQVFAASSGFQLPARRGYYDLLLTSGIPRWQIALAHCVSSIVPGIASWISIGALEIAASHGSRFTSSAGGTCVAFIAVSVIAWAVAVPTSRATSAVVWLLTMTVPPVSRFASPVQLLGVERLEPLTMTLPTALAIVLFALGFARIVSAPVPLEAAQ
jgi:hypothetical protein